MNLHVEFTIRDKTLNCLIDNKGDIKNLCIFLKESDKIKNFRKNTKGLILLKFTIIGLLKSGFDKKEILEALKKLLEIDKNQLSPGNEKIH